MADEDEIDILSDFSLDNLLQKSEAEIYNHSELNSHNTSSLTCDCSAPWSSDHTSHALWDSNDHSDYTTELPQDTLYNLSENVIASSLSSDAADNSGWTKDEKNLLARGIEIFGKSSVRLAQFIGSKTPNQIKTYLKNSYSNNKPAEIVYEETIFEDVMIEEKHISDNVILDDAEIPASIEEVIAVVSTAVPTVTVNSFTKGNKIEPDLYKKRGKNYKNVVSTENLLLKKKMTKLFERRKEHSKRMLNVKKQKYNPEKSRWKVSNNGLSSSGVKAKWKMKSFNLEHAMPKTSVNEPSKKNKLNIISSVNGEEVVKMRREVLEEESLSDIEVDVENMNGDEERESDKIQLMEVDDSTKTTIHEKFTSNNTDENIQNTVTENLLDVSEKVLEQLFSLEVPQCELMLEHHIVSDLEKVVNKEFFCGRPIKTPQRYLKIRNHILSMWAISKPNYVTKTFIRNGLKNCGDVNSISRIHQFLEQIGAINFGCTLLKYIRPLSNLFLEPTPIFKGKAPSVPLPKPAVLSRPRIKKKFTHDGEGGCTLMHNEKGDVISTTVVNEEPVVKLRSHNKKPSVRLIYCKPFNDTYPQPYSILLNLSSLLLMDFHAHLSHTEVMGLIGGHWNAESRKLAITCYVPCKNIAPSSTHCDMCPVSQAEAADVIHLGGLNILGWFHSHPTFAPEPSQQDLDTQLTVQQQIGISKPCIGLILSPFSAHGALIASPYRCLIVDKKHNIEDQYIPYKFKIELVSSDFEIDTFLSQVGKIYTKECCINESDKVDLRRPYFLDSSISYLDKFLSSVKMHLAKCADVNKMSCDSIISGLSSICLNKS